MMRHPVPSHVVNRFADDTRRARVAALSRAVLLTVAVAAAIVWVLS